ncbi:tRNA pseudouridine(38-40) synthase TruA [uncultured Zhongshania sp.]|uniref:tRNA pseudouridine(38-40) synthase TruA n=1 Tax=uncultured Zhongshania sp. TaxID=1642288 RepID=UPI0025F034FB|nr:tRNA pseudouridine(38-40) synthase TruA [uncultured Zhongshania sp.]
MIADVDCFDRFEDEPLPVGCRIAMAVEYQGSAYRGWQSQDKPRVATVQDSLQAAISSIAATTVTVICAGRTDAGVHATHQIVHFDATVSRSLKAWVAGVNAKLPEDIAVQWAKPVSNDFHARFSATARRYRYIILNQARRSAHLAKGVTLIDQPLDADLMHQEAQVLLGEQDFSAFRAASCQSKTAMRNIHHANVSRYGRYIVLDIAGNAFLHHMVRNIAGVLIAVGSGQMPVGWTQQVLNSRDRNQGGVTAKPHGLYLVDVSYPAHFELPESRVGPDFVPS